MVLEVQCSVYLNLQLQHLVLLQEILQHKSSSVHFSRAFHSRFCCEENCLLLCSPLLLPIHAMPMPCVCVHANSECFTLGRGRKHTVGYDFPLLQVFPVLYSLYWPPVSALCLLADHWATIPKPKAAVLAIAQVLFFLRNCGWNMFV